MISPTVSGPAPVAGPAATLRGPPAGLALRLLLVLLAAAPVLHLLARGAQASRDIVYWDEFDTALALVLRLDEGVGVRAFFGELFSVNNEHRMVTSRLLFAASYRLTGTVDFEALGAIGNASIVLLGALLVAAAGSPARRLRLALPLAFLLFNLLHYENFFWSGASIDHFTVVLFAGAAVVGVARRSWAGLAAGAGGAVLAGFTLAHGLLVWPLGAAMLALDRRWRHLAVWLALGALAAAAFLAGFEGNRAHQFAAFSTAGAWSVLRYWLTLLGAVPALGGGAAAPWAGAALLAALGWLAAHGALRRERVALPLALFGVGALALVALGRAEQSGGVVHSRYLVLGALAWALTVFMMLERYTHPRRPLGLLVPLVPLLVLYGFAANRAAAASADSWIECRDRAAVRYAQHGADGKGPFALYPKPERSTQLLAAAARRGVYRPAPVCEARQFDAPTPSSRISYFVDEMTADGRAAFVGGWAAIPGETARRGTLHLVLRSETAMHVYTTVTASRPDVVAASREKGWLQSGFRFARSRDRLPSGNFQVGFLIVTGDGAEFIMTSHRLHLTGKGEALLATGD
jgi:hypothetical protein